MSMIRKTIFAAATVAVAFSSMAIGSNADAFQLRLNIGGGHHGLYIGNHAPVLSCWRPVWTRWGVVQRQFFGYDCLS